MIPELTSSRPGGLTDTAPGLHAAGRHTRPGLSQRPTDLPPKVLRQVASRSERPRSVTPPAQTHQRFTETATKVRPAWIGAGHQHQCCAQYFREPRGLVGWIQSVEASQSGRYGRVVIAEDSLDSKLAEKSLGFGKVCEGAQHSGEPPLQVLGSQAGHDGIQQDARRQLEYPTMPPNEAGRFGLGRARQGFLLSEASC
ncbi:hypothetical protein ABI59_21500 [Acidobacteria bacterium Mor1]|nr:hypothetical protein ABI59_21500 [Acidobacteria bacterium Mor1]